MSKRENWRWKVIRREEGRGGKESELQEMRWKKGGITKGEMEGKREVGTTGNIVGRRETKGKRMKI